MGIDTQPTPPQQRIAALDMMRGIALLGIFIVNMQFYTGPNYFWGMAGFVPFDTPTDQWIRLVVDIFATGKFLGIFAFLFGLGAAMQLRRAERRGDDGGALLLRRFFVLLLIGMIHIILIWMGDILALYAIFGFSLLLFQTWDDRRLVRLAGLCGAIVGLLLLILVVASWGKEPGVGTQWQLTMLKEAETAIETYSTGSFGAIVSQRIFDFQFNTTFALTGLPIPFGLFLLGFVAGRTRYLEGLSERPGQLRQLTFQLLVGGLVMSGVGALLEQSEGANAGLPALGELLHTLGAPVLSLGYIGAVFLLARSALGRRLLAPFAAAGRMTLTNYLLQSLIVTTLMYSYGFGWYGRTTPVESLAIVGVVFVLQLIGSSLWFRYFQYGPLEWLWRSVTYRSWQPMRAASPR